MKDGGEKMARKNAHDFRCAQELAWEVLRNPNRAAEATPATTDAGKAVIRRRGGTSVRLRSVARRPLSASERRSLGLRS